MIIDTEKFQEWMKHKAGGFDRHTNEILVAVPFEKSCLSKKSISEDERKRLEGQDVWENAFEQYELEQGLQKNEEDLER